MWDVIALPYVVSGFLVGALVGQTGVGGGSLMTPLLILVFGINPVAAVGTDLLYAALTKSVGTLVHGMHHSVDWRMVRHLATGSLPATLITLLLLSVLSRGGHGTSLVSPILGAALLLTAVLLVYRRPLIEVVHPVLARLSQRQVAALTTAAGALLGVLVTISSVGAGALGATMLVLLYPRTSLLVIVGSDIAHAVPLTLIAGLGHWWLGSVDWVVLGSLLCGSIPGIIIGSLIAVRIPERVLRPMLAAVLTVAGGRLLF